MATATACALVGLTCVIYMGENDMQRQSLNVLKMRILGAEVVPVMSGSRTLKDAINEALRDWVTNVTTTHYLIGSAIGPDPFPQIVRYFQSIIGIESKDQMLKNPPFHNSEGPGRLPDVVVACVGGGSNAIGSFSAFIDQKSVRLVGVEGGGRLDRNNLSSKDEAITSTFDSNSSHDVVLSQEVRSKSFLSNVKSNKGKDESGAAKHCATLSTGMYLSLSS